MISEGTRHARACLFALLVAPFTFKVDKCDDDVVEDGDAFWWDKERRGIFTAEAKPRMRLDKGGDVRRGGGVIRPEWDELRRINNRDTHARTTHLRPGIPDLPLVCTPVCGGEPLWPEGDKPGASRTREKHTRCRCPTWSCGQHVCRRRLRRGRGCVRATR